MTTVLEAMPGFKFGCDPELFVVDSNGEFVSAEGLIPGTKEEPFKVDLGAVQVDGMAAEFNIDPATSFEEFDTNIVTVLKQLKGMLPSGYSLVAAPAVTFSEAVWDAAPDKAKELGCSPDFDAWTGGVNPPPHDPENPRLRTASGHLHIGWTKDVDFTDSMHMKNCRDLVRQLDWYLGLWSLQKDPDPVRRRLYGKAGACRFKPYGVEYRVLSNFWVTSKLTRRAVWNRMQQAIKDMHQHYLPDYAKKFEFNDRVIKSINESQRDGHLEERFRFPVSTLSTIHREF